MTKMKQIDRARVWVRTVLVIGLISTPAARSFGQSDGHDSGTTYTWHSELVELDADRDTVTLRSRILSYAETDDLAACSPGDEITLIWSGANGRASGIRGVSSTPREDWNEPFTMPAEFVATERDGAYLTFRLPLPPPAVDALRSLMPGEWVTLSSRQRPSGLNEAVISARPYSS